MPPYRRPSEIAMEAAAAAMTLHPAISPIPENIPGLIKYKGWEVEHSVQDEADATFWVDGERATAMIVFDKEDGTVSVFLGVDYRQNPYLHDQFRGKVERLLSTNGYEVVRK